MQEDARDDHCAQAERLLEIWGRLSRTHMMAGGSCSCGVGGFVVALADVEQDIAEFVVAETHMLDRADVLAVMENCGRDSASWSISALLSSMADGNSAIDPRVAAFILERLERTLRSFEKLHGGS